MNTIPCQKHVRDGEYEVNFREAGVVYPALYLLLLTRYIMLQIGLQFPDELMCDAVAVTLAISKAVEGQVFVLGDTSYGR